MPISQQSAPPNIGLRCLHLLKPKRLGLQLRDLLISGRLIQRRWDEYLTHDQCAQYKRSKSVHSALIFKNRVYGGAQEGADAQAKAYDDLDPGDDLHHVVAVDVGQNAVSSELKEHVTLPLEETEGQGGYEEVLVRLYVVDQTKAKSRDGNQEKPKNNSVFSPDLIFDICIKRRKNDLCDGKNRQYKRGLGGTNVIPWVDPEVI